MPQTLYYGGDIVTMAAAPPPEALLVADGRIAALGTLADLESAFPQAAKADLQGAALLPAFIDAHSHFSSVAASLLQLQLGEATSPDEVREQIRRYIAENQIAPGQWVNASGYDDARLGGHPTKALLDEAAPHNPVVAQHTSGHVGVLNTAALATLGVDANTPVPPGGKIAFDEGGHPTGYMEEGAFLACLKKVPTPEPAALLAAFAKAQDIYASHGIATVQEGLMVEAMLPLYRALLASGTLKLDVVGYPEPAAAPLFFNALPGHNRQYAGHFKLGGCKLFLDGSPQARTAWLTRPYLGCRPDEQLASPDSGYCGHPAMADGAVRAAVAAATESGLQLLAHCNGDAAAQQFMDACASVAASDPRLNALRPVMIHAQLLRPAQLVEMRAKNPGMIPSFFVAHIARWGELHLRNLGPERAGHLSPAGSALKAGVLFTLHQDAPVLPPDMLHSIWCAVNRVTDKGTLLGAEERISTREALRAVTENAAYQYFEEGEKGTLAPGKRADFTILTGNPLTTSPEALRDLRVLATLKDGVCIWQG
ncbi:MAG: amidohydrolase [Gemmiger sp.]|nr:amidohydrolase [Gemmiger sp.]